MLGKILLNRLFLIWVKEVFLKVSKIYEIEILGRGNCLNESFNG